ncbi:hypothetical protein BRDCF_p1632 [Bacteroidales bacterium CF]|nr:hypothetical protein BRDCF_p1632 [Bacteroidales bacterium CF]
MYPPGSMKVIVCAGIQKSGIVFTTISFMNFPQSVVPIICETEVAFPA